MIENLNSDCVCEQYEYKEIRKKDHTTKVILVHPMWVSPVPTILVRFSTR